MIVRLRHRIGGGANVLRYVGAGRKIGRNSVTERHGSFVLYISMELLTNGKVF